MRRTATLLAYELALAVAAAVGWATGALPRDLAPTVVLGLLLLAALTPLLDPPHAPTR